jgi:hypothetical protein
LAPSLGVLESYGGATAEYHNALGFFVLSEISFVCLFEVMMADASYLVWAVLDIFFMLGALPMYVSLPPYSSKAIGTLLTCIPSQ